MSRRHLSNILVILAYGDVIRYLLSYDPLAFHAYLETIVASNSVSASGAARQHHSPWLLTDAAHIIFQVAKRRCYTLSAQPVGNAPPTIDLVDDDEAWAALDDVEGHIQGKQGEKKLEWLPAEMEPVLEELPKWNLLAATLQEIEEEIIRQEGLGASQCLPQFHLCSYIFYCYTALQKGTNTVLVMTSSTRASALLTEFLGSMDPTAPSGQQGRKMMEDKLRLYLWWKSKLSEDASKARDGKPPTPVRKEPDQELKNGLSEALRKKDRDKADRIASRRRVRGGAAASIASDRSKGKGPAMSLGEEVMRDEAKSIAQLYV